MCTRERAIFGKTVKDVSAFAGKMSKTQILGAVKTFPQDLSTRVQVYNKAANAKAAKDGNMSDAEHTAVMANHKAITDAYAKALKMAEQNQEKSLKTKSVIMQ
jgi:hypothetical protein